MHSVQSPNKGMVRFVFDVIGPLIRNDTVHLQTYFILSYLHRGLIKN